MKTEIWFTGSSHPCSLKPRGGQQHSACRWKHWLNASNLMHLYRLLVNILIHFSTDGGLLLLYTGRIRAKGSRISFKAEHQTWNQPNSLTILTLTCVVLRYLQHFIYPNMLTVLVSGNPRMNHVCMITHRVCWRAECNNSWPEVSP